ncbi:hypothetical protein [Bergeyella sp. RCAD1439]|uniref:hypothetical protein n=1 Tax=Bergeyella anatis TaxID=3113737 RepID=UPI002E1887F2|nr:hypothetical protein [Bergeyella sp. RCAD1439]
MKSRNIVSLIMFALFILSYFFYREYQKTETERTKEANLNFSFSGKIDSMYIDNQNHGWLIIVLSTKEVLRFNGSDRHMYEKNDSIVKRKGEDSIYIYRDGMVKSYKY